MCIVSIKYTTKKGEIYMFRGQLVMNFAPFSARSTSLHNPRTSSQRYVISLLITIDNDCENFITKSDISSQGLVQVTHIHTDR